VLPLAHVSFIRLPAAGSLPLALRGLVGGIVYSTFLFLLLPVLLNMRYRYPHVASLRKGFDDVSGANVQSDYAPLRATEFVMEMIRQVAKSMGMCACCCSFVLFVTLWVLNPLILARLS
jgi:hypothetical protein